MNSFINLFLKTVIDFDEKLLLNVKYDLKIKVNKEFLKKIKENRDIDLAKKYTSFGPHKDDVVFLWNKQKIKNHGSQGEHKIFLALLKITEYIFLSNKTKKTPIFLIDDMFANLDRERSKDLLRFIEKIKTVSRSNLIINENKVAKADKTISTIITINIFILLLVAITFSIKFFNILIKPIFYQPLLNYLVEGMVLIYSLLKRRSVILYYQLTYSIYLITISKIFFYLKERRLLEKLNIYQLRNYFFLHKLEPICFSKA